MNYPFRTAILNYMRGLDDGSALARTVETIQENYPKQVFLSNMNLLGTHDTARILTALVDDFNGSRAEKAQRSLSPNQLELAKKRGVKSILVTRFRKSPAAKLADVVLCCGSNEGPYQFGSVPAKIAQLVVIDFLFQEYCHRNWQACEANRLQIGDALAQMHI
jgi:hypothetical protein